MAGEAIRCSQIAKLGGKNCNLPPLRRIRARFDEAKVEDAWKNYSRLKNAHPPEFWYAKKLQSRKSWRELKESSVVEQPNR
jgi:hypothetical protein